ncbi:hypothetical protein JW930_05045 [Candidatus Woesearchaeota archaeon]|nr:hypothetical protein [Candidatus Woesearchaeota archaeon]
MIYDPSLFGEYEGQRIDALIRQWEGPIIRKKLAVQLQTIKDILTDSALSSLEDELLRDVSSTAMDFYRTRLSRARTRLMFDCVLQLYKQGVENRAVYYELSTENLTEIYTGWLKKERISTVAGSVKKGTGDSIDARTVMKYWARWGLPPWYPDEIEGYVKEISQQRGKECAQATGAYHHMMDEMKKPLAYIYIMVHDPTSIIAGAVNDRRQITEQDLCGFQEIFVAQTGLHLNTSAIKEYVKHLCGTNYISAVLNAAQDQNDLNEGKRDNDFSLEIMRNVPLEVLQLHLERKSTMQVANTFNELPYLSPQQVAALGKAYNKIPEAIQGESRDQHWQQIIGRIPTSWNLNETQQRQLLNMHSSTLYALGQFTAAEIRTLWNYHFGETYQLRKHFLPAVA